MKDTPQIIEARIRAGYRPPQERPIICRNCGAAGFNPTPYRHRYFCKRSQFYVHSCGYCPAFSTEPYTPPPPPAKRPSPYNQPELF